MGRITGIVMAAAVLASSGTLAYANDSAYTVLDTQNCKTMAEPAADEPGGDFFVGLCAGYEAYPVVFKESDLRVSVHFGFLDQRIIDEAFESFAQFNNPGSKIEWRLDATGKPVATILRMFISNIDPETGGSDNKALQGEVLVVSKVGQPDDATGCVIGYVDARANKDANMLARDIADNEAETTDCTTHQPDYAGERGPLSGANTNIYPERQ
jgi:hypothetical protein